MMETSRVLSMLNAQAARQLQKEQLDAAKRSVNEAIRYYDDYKSINNKTNFNPNPNEIALLRCQAQVSALLKLKIGRLEAALGSQTHNDRLVQSGKKVITQSSRTLRGMLQDKKRAPRSSVSVGATAAASQVSAACRVEDNNNCSSQDLDERQSPSRSSSFSQPNPKQAASTNNPPSMMLCAVPSRPSSSNIQVLPSAPRKLDDLGCFDCFASLKQRHHLQQQQKQLQASEPAPVSTTPPPEGDAEDKVPCSNIAAAAAAPYSRSVSFTK